MTALALSSPNHHDAKHVSFHEKIDTIETDGTVGRASLKQAKVVLIRHTSLPLDFDFGHCEAADSQEEQENELDFRSSYKKFAPRSQLAYIKRASM